MQINHFWSEDRWDTLDWFIPQFLDRYAKKPDLENIRIVSKFQAVIHISLRFLTLNVVSQDMEMHRVAKSIYIMIYCIAQKWAEN